MWSRPAAQRAEAQRSAPWRRAGASWMVAAARARISAPQPSARYSTRPRFGQDSSAAFLRVDRRNRGRRSAENSRVVGPFSGRPGKSRHARTLIFDDTRRRVLVGAPARDLSRRAARAQREASADVTAVEGGRRAAHAALGSASAVGDWRPSGRGAVAGLVMRFLTTARSKREQPRRRPQPITNRVRGDRRGSRRRSARGSSATQPCVGGKPGLAQCRKMALPRPFRIGRRFAERSTTTS